MNAALKSLLEDRRVWRGAQASAKLWQSGLSTGFAALDECLPGGGWPIGALTEIVPERDGLGELRLLMPALASLSRGGYSPEAGAAGWVVWIAPPYLPYAPALAAAGIELARLLVIRAQKQADALWATEQTLRSGACGAVLSWLTGVDDRGLRRLQLAAEEGKSWGVVFRPLRTLEQSSPAALRLRVLATPEGTELQILKCRGSKPRHVRIPARG